MPIPQKVYVDLTSAVVGASGPTQGFSGRVFTKDPALTEPLHVNTAEEVMVFFGDTSPEYKFAVKYFGVVTPAPVSKPKELQFYPHGAAETMLAAWTAAEALSDSYGSFFFLSQGVLTEIGALASANAALNVKHIFYVSVIAADVDAWSSALIDSPSVGLIYETGTDLLPFLPMALLDATNWHGKNATMNYMFRDAPGAKFQVDTNAIRKDLDEKRVNYYGRTRRAGQNVDFFQRGYLCGSDRALQDMSVHAGEQWLRARIDGLWFDLLLGTRGIPANLDGIARGNKICAQVVEEGLYNGVIVRGKDLSVTQKIAIGDATGDDLAWAQVQNSGAWFDVRIVPYTGDSGLSEYKMQYTFVYAKGDWVRKIEGSHNLV